MTECVICQARTDSFACVKCLRRCERRIGDVPALLAELEVTVSRQSRTYRARTARRAEQECTAAAPEARADRHSRPDGTLMPELRSRDGRIALRAFPLPVDLDAAQVRWDVLNTLGTWARHLAEQRGAEPPDDDRLIGWLLFNADAIRHDEAAAEIIDEIEYAHDQLERAIDRSPERIYAGPCRAEHADVCCVRDLYARPDGELVCDGHRGDHEGCRAEHSMADRDAMIRAELEDRLLPLEDALDALHWWRLSEPPRRIVNDWVRRGRLPEHDAAGRPVFALAVLIELVRGYRPHAYPQNRRTRVLAS